MHDVLAPELPLFLGLAVATLAFGAGCFFASTAAGIFGLSFLAIAAGVYIAAAALPKLVDAIIYVMDRVQENGWKIVAFVGLVLTAIIAVMIAHNAGFAKAVVGLVDSIVTTLQKGSTLGKLLGVIGLFIISALKTITAMAPLLSQKLVGLVVSVINGIAESIRSNRGEIIGAFGNLLSSLFELLLTAIGEVGGKVGGALITGLRKLFPKLFNDKSPEEAGQDWYNKSYDYFDGVADSVSEMTHRKGKDAGTEYAAGVQEGLNEDMSDDELAALINETVQGVADEASQSAYDAGSDIVGSGVEGATDAAESIEIPGMPNVSEMLGMDGLTDGSEFSAQKIIDDTANIFGGEDASNTIAASLSGMFGNAFGNADFISNLTGYGEDGSQTILGGLTDYLGGEQVSSDVGLSFTNMFSNAFGSDNFISSLTGQGEGAGQSVISSITGFLGGGDSQTSMENAGVNVFGFFSNKYQTESNDGTPTMGHNTVVGLYNSIIAKASDLMSRAGKYTFAKYREGYDTAADQNSPSREMMKEGRWTIIGLANGLEKYAGIAYGAGTDVADGLLDEFKNAMANVVSVASDEIEFSPTITPVVDMSNARMAAGSMNSMFGSGYRSYVDGITARAGDVNQSIDYNLQNKEVVSEVRSLSSRLDLLGDKIANMQIVLDSGLMVGAMAPQMDSRLGQIAVRKGRGN